MLSQKHNDHQCPIAVEPKSGRFESLERAVVDGGGSLVSASDAAGLVWADAAKPHLLKSVLDASPKIRWVGLPFAGIEPYVPLLDTERVWTCARGVYARPVAEHAVMLGLAGLRGLATFARASRWSPPEGVNLVDGRITVFGAGGITTELVGLLRGFDCEITVVRKSPEPFAGAARTIAYSERASALPGADLVVLALALTPETRHAIDASELAVMEPHSWIVNVARGGHINAEALVKALDDNRIGGACLDVTDPEPLPEGHRLWSHPKVLITPHVGNTREMGVPLLAAHVRENVIRFSRNEPLAGVVSIQDGY